MGLFGRNGKEPGTALVPSARLESRAKDDGWGDAAEARAADSGVWVVIRLDSQVKEGQWTENRYSSRGVVKASMLTPADDGIDAIKKLYDRDYNVTDESQADGRYIALDFYGGERVEALVTGEWRVKIDVAPPALGG